MPHGPYASPNNLYETDHREIEIAFPWLASLHCVHIRRAGLCVTPCIHFVQTCKFAPYPYKLPDVDNNKNTLTYNSGDSY